MPLLHSLLLEVKVAPCEPIVIATPRVLDQNVRPKDRLVPILAERTRQDIHSQLEPLRMQILGQSGDVELARVVDDATVLVSVVADTPPGVERDVVVACF